jgi:Ran GTPase-activating protein (RanGAP) involved in mRNA processing and transport
MHDLEEFTYASNNRGIDESDMKTLGSLTKLKWIALSGEKAVNDITIAHLSNLEELEYLMLNDTSISDRALLTLKELPELSVLELRGTQVGDEGMGTLAGITDLASLDLSGTRVTGRGLALLKDLRVNSLTLSGRGVTDGHVAGLTQWKDLKTLDLSGEYDLDRDRSIPNRITINGIKTLSQMTQLDVLKLNDNPQITDATVPYLSRLENLVALELLNTGITPAGGRKIADAVDGLDYDELLIREE